MPAGGRNTQGRRTVEVRREDFMEDWPEEDVLEYQESVARLKEMSDEELMSLRIDAPDRPPLMATMDEMRKRGLLKGT